MQPSQSNLGPVILLETISSFKQWSWNQEFLCGNCLTSFINQSPCCCQAWCCHNWDALPFHVLSSCLGLTAIVPWGVFLLTAGGKSPSWHQESNQSRSLLCWKQAIFYLKKFICHLKIETLTPYHLLNTGRIYAAWPPGYNSTYLSRHLRRCGRPKLPTGQAIILQSHKYSKW